MNFMSDALADRRKVRNLNILDEYSSSALFNEVVTMKSAPSQSVLVRPNQFLLGGSDIEMTNETTSAVEGPQNQTGLEAAENRSQIWQENQNLGNDDWRFSNRASGNEIACYLSQISINKGQSVELKIHSQDSKPCTLGVYRLGDYGGAGARLFQPLVNDIPASPQNDPVIEGLPESPRIRLTRCNWTTAHTLQTDVSWVTGLYWLKLTQNDTGKETAVILIVRDDEKVADIVFKSNSFTWLAYNSWNFGANPKYTIYDFRSTNPPGRSMASSYQRPWSWATIDGEDDNPNTWEQPNIQWLESLGYEIKYVDDIDVHLQGTALMDRSKALIIPGHSEYWTLEQYQAIAGIRDAGKHLVFMGANVAYWRVRLEDTNQPGAGIEGDRQQMICHKNNEFTSTGVPEDWIDDPITPTDLFRSDRVITLSGGTAPESKLLGVQFIGNTGGPEHAQPLVVQNNHLLFDNTGFIVGSTIGNLVGFEWDHVNPGDGIVTSAEGALTVLARGTISTVDTTYASTFIQPGNVAANRSDMTIYRAPSAPGASGSGWVFAAGSLNATFGLKEGRKLDGSNWTANRESPGFKRMIYNLLNLMGCQSEVEVPPIVSPQPGQPQTLFGNQTPASTDFADSPEQDYELGTVFSSNVAGNINAIRYYKALSEIGSHIGNIWNASTRELLISVAFTGDSGSGWQEQTLPTPLPISASTNYIVSVNANTHYVSTEAGTLNPIISGNLSATEGGRFNETVGQFPDNPFTLYSFRDIVFVANS
jgi:Domain of unknown function (DUF4082)